RWRHVLHRGNSGLLQIDLEVEIEIRGIHADEKCRAMSQEMVAQAPADAHNLAVMLEDFHVAEHAKLVHRVEQARAYGLHLRPANAHELQFWPVPEHRAHEMGGEL